MFGYVVRRMFWMPVILFIVSFIAFALTRFGPGDPVAVAAGQIRDPIVLERVRAERGLDKSVVEQYWRWASGAVRGDFGESYQQRGFTVGELIYPKMWISAQLGIVALILVFGVGIPLGLLAARLSGTWIDPLIISGLLSLRAIPSLVLIPPLIWLFAVQLDLLPAGGWGGGLIDIYWVGGVLAIPIPDPHIYIPMVAFTLPGFAGVARLVRVTALEVQTEDFVRTARAKGLSESAVTWRHVFPNSMLPLITVVGFALASVLEGAFFVETLYGIPGIARFTLNATLNRDYDVIMATTVIFAAVFVFMNLIVDIAYGFVDPRIRLGGGVTS